MPETKDPYAELEPVYNPATTLAPKPEAGGPNDPDSHNAFADSFRAGWMGQLHEAWQVEKQAWQATPDGFDPLANIPKGYEGYASAFAAARNPGMIEATKQQIDANTALRARREARGTASTIGTDLLTAIADPTNLIGGVEVKALSAGKGILEGAAKGAGVIGSVGVVQEIARTHFDPTATPEEAVWGVGGALAMGGLLGGVIGGAVGRSAARSIGRASEGAAARSLGLPLRGDPRITSRFGQRSAPKAGASTNHKGVDFAVPPGTPVFAQREGVVEVARDTGKGGLTVRVNYGNGIKATFMHLSEAAVHEGDTVRPGQTVAKSGNSGNSTGPHLHYQLEVNGKKVDPFDFHGKPLPTDPHAIGAAAAPTREPAGTVNVLEGIEIPEKIDFDGRGVPIIVGKTPTGAPAMHVHATPAETIIAREQAALEAEMRGGAADEPLHVAEPDLEQAQREAVLSEGSTFPDHIEGAAPEAPATKTVKVKRYDKRGRVIGEREEQVPLSEPVPKDKPDAGPVHSDAPTYDPAAVNRMADRLEARADALEAARGPAAIVQSLRNAATEARDSVTFSDGHFAPGVDGAERFIAGEARGGSKPDEELRLLRMADDAKRAQDFDSGELADELPFGMSHPGAHAEHDGEHMIVDVEGILSSFGERPWTQPRIEGVAAFPDDAFQTPGEWLNFVLLHEREHGVNPRGEGESVADYENRINSRAWDQLQGDLGAHTPEGGTLARMAIAPTPMGQVQRLITDTDAAIHESLFGLAGDMATMLVRNRKGGASQAGGSVFQRAERWLSHQFDIRQSIRTSYLDYLGKTSTGSRLQTEMQIVAARVPGVGTAARQGQMSLNEFRAMVGRAVVDREAHVPEEARRAAAVFTATMQRVEQQARELGLFQSTRGNLRRAEAIERRASRIEDTIGRLDEVHHAEDIAEMRAIAERMRHQAEEFRSQAAEPVMPHDEQDYMPRYWNTGALKDNPEGAVAMLERGYLRDGYPPEMASHAAHEAYAKLISEPDGEFTPGRPSALNHRSLPVTNAEAWDFIVQDPELLGAAYLRRMGAAIEMTRRFGDPAGLDELDSLRADLMARGVPREQREAALQLWEDARDRVAGGFHGKDPMSWDNRTARAIKNFANIAVMGKVIYSQVSDVARTIGTNPGAAVHTLMAAMSGDLARLNPGSYAKQSGEALELVLARASAHFVESDDALLVTSSTKLERGLAKAQTPFFVANLMTPFTVIMKEWAGLIAAHSIIDDSHALTAALHAGAEPEAKTVTRLAKYGIDPHMAQLIASMPTEQGASGLHLPNVMAWEGEPGMHARDAFLAAVNGQIRSSVPGPGPLDKPAIFDGVFHTKKGREEALAQVHQLGREADDLRLTLRRMGGRADDDAEKLRTVAELKTKIGELNRARRTVGQRGRKEMPLASLPFQMHSFAVSAGGKVLHGLINGADRNRTAMIMSLLAGGAVATWMKSVDPIGSTVAALIPGSDAERDGLKSFDRMSWPEYIAHSFDNSSVPAWFADAAKAADTLTGGYALGTDEHHNGLGLTYNDDNRWSDNAGAVIGAGPSVFAGAVEAMTSDDMPANQRVSALRRTVPFGNLVWWDKVTKEIGHSLDQPAQLAAGSGAASAPDEPGVMAMGDGVGSLGLPALPADLGQPQALPTLPAAKDLPMPDATKKPKASKARRARVTRPVLF